MDFEVNYLITIGPTNTRVKLPKYLPGHSAKKFQYKHSFINDVHVVNVSKNAFEKLKNYRGLLNSFIMSLPFSKNDTHIIKITGRNFREATTRSPKRIQVKGYFVEKILRGECYQKTFDALRWKHDLEISKYQMILSCTTDVLERGKIMHEISNISQRIEKKVLPLGSTVYVSQYGDGSDMNHISPTPKPELGLYEISTDICQNLVRFGFNSRCTAEELEAIKKDLNYKQTTIAAQLKNYRSEIRDHHMVEGNIVGDWSNGFIVEKNIGFYKTHFEPVRTNGGGITKITNTFMKKFFIDVVYEEDPNLLRFNKVTKSWFYLRSTKLVADKLKAKETPYKFNSSVPTITISTENLVEQLNNYTNTVFKENFPFRLILNKDRSKVNVSELDIPQIVVTDCSNNLKPKLTDSKFIDNYKFRIYVGKKIPTIKVELVNDLTSIDYFAMCCNYFLCSSDFMTDIKMTDDYYFRIKLNDIDRCSFEENDNISNLNKNNFSCRQSKIVRKLSFPKQGKKEKQFYKRMAKRNQKQLMKQQNQIQKKEKIKERSDKNDTFKQDIYDTVLKSYFVTELNVKKCFKILGVRYKIRERLNKKHMCVAQHYKKVIKNKFQVNYKEKYNVYYLVIQLSLSILEHKKLNKRINNLRYIKSFLRISSAMVFDINNIDIFKIPDVIGVFLGASFNHRLPLLFKIKIWVIKKLKINKTITTIIIIVKPIICFFLNVTNFCCC
jgi:hypothetical protein